MTSPPTKKAAAMGGQPGHDRKKQKPAKSGDFKRSYWRKAYSTMDPHMARFYKRFRPLEANIRRAGIRLTYEAYVSGMVFTSALATGLGLIVSFIVLAFFRVPLGLKIGLPFGIAVLAGAATFGIHYMYPRTKAGGTKRKVDEDLAFVASRMTVLSASGMTPETIIREIAGDDSKDAITLEFRKIVRDMNLLGMDLTQALVEERKRTASQDFASFLDGMISTSNSGANMQSYLVKQSKTLMNDKRLKTKAFSETLGIIAEMYTTMLVVMPLILIILFAVMGVISGSLGGISISLLIELVVYVMVPIGGAVIMVMADGIMPKR